MAEKAIEVVLTGQKVVGEGAARKVKEFSRVIVYDHKRHRTITTDDRTFEYVGDDAHGRRIYRDQTRY